MLRDEVLVYLVNSGSWCSCFTVFPPFYHVLSTTGASKSTRESVTLLKYHLLESVCTSADLKEGECVLLCVYRCVCMTALLSSPFFYLI